MKSFLAKAGRLLDPGAATGADGRHGGSQRGTAQRRVVQDSGAVLHVQRLRKVLIMGRD